MPINVCVYIHISVFEYKYLKGSEATWVDNAPNKAHRLIQTPVPGIRYPHLDGRSG